MNSLLIEHHVAIFWPGLLALDQDCLGRHRKSYSFRTRPGLRNNKGAWEPWTPRPYSFCGAINTCPIHVEVTTTPGSSGLLGSWSPTLRCDAAQHLRLCRDERGVRELSVSRADGHPAPVARARARRVACHLSDALRIVRVPRSRQHLPPDARDLRVPAAQARRARAGRR